MTNTFSAFTPIKILFAEGWVNFQAMIFSTHLLPTIILKLCVSSLIFREQIQGTLEILLRYDIQHMLLVSMVQYF